jgi:uncharacterized repeat protein (TIGR03987 family)
MNPLSSIIITLALLFYSIGVWGERITGKLKPWHLVFFVFGLICDIWGTGMMFVMAGGMTFDIHGITGLVVLLRKEGNAISNFHKFSVGVWFIWLIPYFSPMFFNLAV